VGEACEQQRWGRFEVCEGSGASEAACGRGEVCTIAAQRAGQCSTALARQRSALGSQAAATGVFAVPCYHITHSHAATAQPSALLCYVPICTAPVSLWPGVPSHHATTHLAGLHHAGVHQPAALVAPSAEVERLRMQEHAAALPLEQPHLAGVSLHL
jgi:hypothetical protein